MCNGAISFVLLYCYIVTLVRLSLVTIKGYLLEADSLYEAYRLSHTTDIFVSYAGILTFGPTYGPTRGFSAIAELLVSTQMTMMIFEY